MKWTKLLFIAVAACFVACAEKEPLEGTQGKNDPVVDNNTSGNTDNTGNDDTTDEEVTFTDKFVGADLSQWLAYKNNNAIWKENGTVIRNIPQYFYDNGYNAARLRLFVNPDLNSAACQDLDYVIESAEAMRDAGMKICLDFHYSDTWADPGKQYKPAAWETLGTEDLAEKVYSYTHEVLTELKSRNIDLALIQTGNEITGGMLWDNGRANVWDDAFNTDEQWNNFRLFLSKASTACREVYPDAKIIIHTDRGGDMETARRYYALMEEVDYDVIGLSYYAYWHGRFSQLGGVINVLSNNHPDKEIMIMETAFGYNEWSDDTASTDYGSYDETPEGQKQFLTDLVTFLKQYDHVTGVFYWFPEETYIDWRCPYRIDQNRGLFDKDTGNTLPAFGCLPEFGK